jgi:hypothetical protein
MKNIDLESMSEAELRELNREIVRRLEVYTYTRRKMQLMSFRIGDRVEFDSDQGTITGTITRLNQKTASIDTGDGRGWRVAPSFLRKIVGPAEERSPQRNLFRSSAEKDH